MGQLPDSVDRAPPADPSQVARRVHWKGLGTIVLTVGLACWGSWSMRRVLVSAPLRRALAARPPNRPEPPRRFLSQGSWSEIHHAFTRSPRQGDPPDADSVPDVPTDLAEVRGRLDGVPHWRTAVLARAGASPSDLARSGLVNASACFGLGNRPAGVDWRFGVRAPYRTWRLSLLDAGDGLVGELEIPFLDPAATPAQLAEFEGGRWAPDPPTPLAPVDWPMATVWERPAPGR